MSSNAWFLVGAAVGSVSVLLGNWTAWFAWKRQSDRYLQGLQREAEAAEQRVRELLRGRLAKPPQNRPS